MKANIFTANNYNASKTQYSLHLFLYLVTLGLLHSTRTFTKGQQETVSYTKKNQTPF